VPRTPHAVTVSKRIDQLTADVAELQRELARIKTERKQMPSAYGETHGHPVRGGGIGDSG
jgi:hypothetical protein